MNDSATPAPCILVLTESPVLAAMLAEHLAPIGNVQRVVNQAIPTDFSLPSSDLLVIAEGGYLEHFPDSVRWLRALSSSLPFGQIRLGNGQQPGEQEGLTLTMPLRLPQLLQMARSELKRSTLARHSQPVVLSALCHYEPGKRQLVHSQSGQSVALTDIEAKMVEYLAQAGTRAVAREELLQNIWGYNSQVATHTLETHLYRLRNKLESLGFSGVDIKADTGGYRLETSTAGGNNS